jgi:enterochelin esterase family protein
MTVIAELMAELRGASDRDAVLRAFLQNNSFPITRGNTATFFFWDGSPAHDVQLLHWVHGLESHQPFNRVQGTNAWVLSLELPLTARVEYKLLIERGGHRQLVRDPMNPHRAFDPFGSNSVCPMPGYRRPAWTLPEEGIRPGTLEQFSFASDVWGDERHVTVYLPNEFRHSRTYPLLIVHDGGDYRKYAGMRVVLDNLIQRHELMPLMVAFIDGHDRNAEFGANPKQPDFLVHELLPELERRYPVSPDRADRALMGASFGGVSSLYAAWTHPHAFGKLLLQSGSFVFTDVGHHGKGPLWDPVVAFVNQLRLDPGRVDAQLYVSCGTFEGLIYYNRSLVPLMRQAGLKLRYDEAPDGHNWINWRDRLRAGLTFLFPGHLWMTYD